jgi:hypothetical protein
VSETICVQLSPLHELEILRDALAEMRDRDRKRADAMPEGDARSFRVGTATACGVAVDRLTPIIDRFHEAVPS